MVFLGKQSLYGAAVRQNTDHKRTNFALGPPGCDPVPCVKPGHDLCSGAEKGDRDT